MWTAYRYSNFQKFGRLGYANYFSIVIWRGWPDLIIENLRTYEIYMNVSSENKSLNVNKESNESQLYDRFIGWIKSFYYTLAVVYMELGKPIRMAVWTSQHREKKTYNSSSKKNEEWTSAPCFKSFQYSNIWFAVKWSRTSRCYTCGKRMKFLKNALDEMH